MTRAGGRGFSLVELLVVLTVTALLAGVAAFAASDGTPALIGTGDEELGPARRAAILTGRPVTVHVVDSATWTHQPVRLLPDGRVIGDGIDPVRGSE